MHTVSVYLTNYNLHQKKYEENLNFNNVIFVRIRLMTQQQISRIEKNAQTKTN